MKTLLGKIATLAATGALICSAQPAMADSEHAAAVVNGGGCTGFVPTEDGKVDTKALIKSVQVVHRVHVGGGQMFAMCQFDVPDGLVPASVRTSEGFACAVSLDGDVTRDSTMQVTPGGRGYLLCRLR